MFLKSGHTGNLIIYVFLYLHIKHGKEEIIGFFFWGMLKEKVWSMKITDATHSIERIKNNYAKINGNVKLLHGA